MRTSSYNSILERFEKQITKESKEYIEELLKENGVSRIVEGEIRHYIFEYLGFESFGGMKKDSPLYTVLRQALDAIAATKGQALIDRVAKRFVLGKRAEESVERAFREGYEWTLRDNALKAGRAKADKDLDAVLKRMKLHVNKNGEELE